MKAELQLAGAFRVLFMGLQWRKAHGVAKAICATLCTITAFSPKMLFVMGDWGNNYTGESLKPEAVQRGRSAQHARVGKKRSIISINQQTCHLTTAWPCVFLLQCYCVQFVFRICLLSRYGVTTFRQAPLLVPAIWCVYYRDGGQTGAMFWLLAPRERCCIWQKSCAYSKTNGVSRLGWDKSVINQFTKPYSLSWLFRPSVFW